MRDIDQKISYTHYVESVSGAAKYGSAGEILDSRLDQAVSLESMELSANPIFVPDDTNARANDFQEQTEIESWNSGGEINGIVDVDLLGVLALISFGDLTTTTPTGATNSRDHLFIPMSLAGLAEPPSTEMGISDVESSKYSGLVGARLNISGGRNQFTRMFCQMIGSGRRDEMPGFSDPTVRVPRKLRDGLSIINFGTPDSTADITAKIVEWELDYNNVLLPRSEFSMDMLELYDSGDEDQGDVAAGAEITERQVAVSLSIELENWDLWDDMKEMTAREIEIISEGNEIESGFFDRMIINAKDIRLRQVGKSAVDGILVWRGLATVFGDTLADVISLTIRNDTAAYGLLQA